MNPLGQTVSGVDLQKVRQQNEDSLQTRATQHLTAEVKTSADSTTTEAEKLTAGETKDLVDVAATPKADPKGKSKSAPKPESGGSSVSSSSTSESSSSSSTSEGGPESKSDSSGPVPPDKPEYTDAEKQFLERLEELNKQAAEQRKMWRKIYMEWVEMQMKWREDLENFAQATYVMWEEVALSRATQSSKHAEAVRALL